MPPFEVCFRQEIPNVSMLIHANLESNFSKQKMAGFPNPLLFFIIFLDAQTAAVGFFCVRSVGSEGAVGLRASFQIKHL